jgi:hypothetical protein
LLTVSAPSLRGVEAVHRPESGLRLVVYRQAFVGKGRGLRRVQQVQAHGGGFGADLGHPVGLLRRRVGRTQQAQQDGSRFGKGE